MSERMKSNNVQRWALAVMAWIGCTWSWAVEPDNAALDYWKAAAMMGEPRSREEWDLVRFIDTELPALPPAVFAAREEAVRWLLRQRAFIRAVEDGGQRAGCRFHLSIPDSPLLRLDHLPAMDAVARRMLAIAKAHEFAGDPRAAAGMLRDMLALISHLDQDAHLASIALGADLMQAYLSALEGFLSRHPPAEAVRLLDACFEQARARLFHPAEALRRERDRFTDWFHSSPLPPEQKLAFFYTQGTGRPGVDLLLPLEEQTRVRVLNEWLTGYEEHMAALADAVGESYGEASLRLRALDGKRGREKQRVEEGGGNPLLPLLAPAMADLYDRMLLAEGQYRVAALLCRAAVVRAETGVWPDALEYIPPYPQGPDFSDPFSGEPLDYRMSVFSPRVTIRLTRRMASENRYRYHVDLATRRRSDMRAAADAVGRLRPGAAHDRIMEPYLYQPVPR